MASSRSTKSAMNLGAALLGQLIGVLVSFVARRVFVSMLGQTYLGLNGLFFNILSMLSLVELGVGPAIVFSLYKPLADNDTQQIRALMKLYQKAYVVIGCVVALLGLACTPFLDFFITDMPDVPHIRWIFLLFVLNSALSYFFSYKRSLVIADQKRYVAVFYQYGFLLLLNVLQIAALYLTRNYFVYLGLQVVCTLAENIAVSRRVDKLYPYLKQKNAPRVDPATAQQITRNTKAMIFHKIGNTVVNSTDNLLISKLISTIVVGLYSNYQMVLNALNTLAGHFFTAITASVGNLGSTEDTRRSREVFDTTFFFNFWVYGWGAIGLFNLFNPLIRLWLGPDFLLDDTVVGLIVVNFYVTGMRKAVLTFRDALGLYWYDRYKPVFESVINLVASILLARYLGVAGIFLGTLISTLTTCFWVEPYVLYRHGFHQPVRPFFVRYGVYTAAALGAGAVTGTLCLLVGEGGIGSFVARLGLCVVVPNLIFWLCFCRTAVFRELVAVALRVLRRVREKLHRRPG